ncbi:hypothetical protein BBK82_04735 [Lentzea guizhouensis]|uniref:TIR domain-containing protein n=1 Tax=Lentzea guizhouensis TaxID=1586287 RepID=A0A1B2HCP5_9PSEU|nr:toll/interleukin-1 receptor domain-containing protein [Lentzea guizhouensis]ANZ35488.1 hypothetical protein BBK82_04735 [Lentzea guizhouensis]
MPQIFVSYRSDDEPTAAVLVHRELGAHFGAEAVFLDGAAIPPGTDYTRALLEGVRTAKVLLVVIGPRWLEARAPGGGRALDQPGDWVRAEIAEAFRCGLTVIPLLVGAAARLGSAPLPADVAALARCQDLRLRPEDAEYDLRRLVAELEALGLRAAPAAGPERNGQVSMRATATGHSRVYQAGGNQVINE